MIMQLIISDLEESTESDSSPDSDFETGTSGNGTSIHSLITCHDINCLNVMSDVVTN